MKSRWEKLRAGRWKESESTKEDGTPTSTSLSPHLARQKCYVRTEHTWAHRCSSQLRDVVLQLGISTVSHEELRMDISSAQPRSRCPSPSCDIWPAPLRCNRRAVSTSGRGLMVVCCEQSASAKASEKRTNTVAQARLRFVSITS